MQEIVSITERGTLTLPAPIRKALGLRGKQQFILESTQKGELLLKPAAVVPLELYSEARIKEFASEESSLAKLLEKKRVRKSEDIP